MRPNHTWIQATTSLLFFTLTTFAVPAAAQDADRPVLSEEIRTVLERDGAAAAERRFNEIFPEQKDEYQIDMEALAEMAQGYMEAGDYESGQAIARMMAAISREMVSTSGMMPSGEAVRRPPEREPSEGEPSEPRRRAEPARDYGPAREDLDRFAGVYGDPSRPDSNRELFVTESCDGYLVAGAMWGDAQNWWMRSVSDNVFEMESDFMSLRLEFALGSDGAAEAMKHDLEGMASPLERVGPLPEGWGDCLQRRGG